MRALRDFAVCADDINKFVVSNALHSVDEHQRSDYFADCFIFLKQGLRYPAICSGGFSTVWAIPATAALR